MSNNSQIVFCASCTYQARKLMIRIDPVLFLLMLILFKQHFYSKSEMDDSGIFLLILLFRSKKCKKYQQDRWIGFELQISGVRINHPTTMLLPVTRKAVAFVVYEIVVVFKAFVQFQIVVLVVYVQRYFVIVGVNTRAGVIFTKLLLLKVVLFCSYFQSFCCYSCYFSKLFLQ